jgi:hypothetical protein
MAVTRQIDEQTLKEALEIDDMQIKAEFIRLPADLAYYNGLYAEAIRTHLRAKHDLDLAGARLYHEHRDRLEATGKPTEKKIDSAVEEDPLYVEARNASDEAEAERLRLRGIVAALVTKCDMLQSLGSYMREEMHDPLVRGSMPRKDE